MKTENQFFFATQRGYGEFKGGWEFPGGKIEACETPHEALKREIDFVPLQKISYSTTQTFGRAEKRYLYALIKLHVCVCITLFKNTGKMKLKDLRKIEELHHSRKYLN